MRLGSGNQQTKGAADRARTWPLPRTQACAPRRTHPQVTAEAVRDAMLAADRLGRQYLAATAAGAGSGQANGTGERVRVD